MPRTRTSALFAAGALAVGAAGGAGGYAAFADGGTTTTGEQAAQAATPAAATKTLGVGAVYESARDGVVEITVTSSGGASDTPFPFGDGSRRSEAQGSGFVYDAAGHIVTNYHVVAGADSITIAFADGRKSKAKVIGTDPSSDLAVLKVDAPASELHPLDLGDSGALAVGDGVVAIGSPFGLEGTVTSGIVSALNRTIGSQTSYSIPGAIQTDAAINHGNSGGPLLDLRGEVVGVNSQIESDSGGNDGVGFAIPSNTVRSVVRQLIGGGKVEHAYLGVSVQTSSTRSGAAIASVKSGSPAADAGLKAGDVVTAFAGSAIATADDLTTAVSTKAPGDDVTVTYVRNGKTKTATVTLGSRSA